MIARLYGGPLDGQERAVSANHISIITTKMEYPEVAHLATEPILLTNGTYLRRANTDEFYWLGWDW